MRLSDNKRNGNADSPLACASSAATACHVSTTDRRVDERLEQPLPTSASSASTHDYVAWMQTLGFQRPDGQESCRPTPPHPVRVSIMVKVKNHNTQLTYQYSARSLQYSLLNTSSKRGAVAAIWQITFKYWQHQWLA